jgi:predicted solute-binding protein
MRCSMQCNLLVTWNKELADRFVAMWVNELTLDYTDRGREAVRRLLDEGFEKGIIPRELTLTLSIRCFG